MHVMIISTVTDSDNFWGALKQAYGQMPNGAKWTLAVASADGTKAVNVLVHDSFEKIKSFFEEHAGPYGATEYFEANAAEAVGLPNG